MKLYQEMDRTENVPIGRHSRTMSVEELNALGHHKRPLLQAIRQNCIDCAGGSQAEVRRCGMVTCPFWPYRMGSNPFVSREMTEEQRTEMGERLRRARSARIPL